MQTFDYLFITGCARSGTSVMANLLRSHPEIAMGRERFSFRYSGKRDFPSCLFEKERFCRQLLPGDSHHERLDAYYEELHARIDQCAYRGDKIPEMACAYAPLLAAYDRPKVIYMLRNIFDVASSFKLRASRARENKMTAGWPWDRGSAAAVAEWSLSLRNTLEVLDRIQVHFVVYERLFESAVEIDTLFGFLNLQITEPVNSMHEGMMGKYRELELAREVSLTSPEKLHIMQSADFESYRRALRVADSAIRPPEAQAR